MKPIIPEKMMKEIKKILQPKKKMGRPRFDDEKVIQGIYYVVKTGCQWSMLPKEYGKTTTVHGRFRKMVKDGTFNKMLKIARLIYKKEINPADIFSMDTAQTKSPLGGDNTGSSPVDRRKTGSKKSMVTDFGGAPLAFTIGASNKHDITLAKATIQELNGYYDTESLKIMAADSAYDARSLKKFLKTQNFVPFIVPNKRRSKKKKEKIKPGYRWTIERTFAWLNHSRGVFIRWCRKSDSFLAFCQFAASYQLFRMAGVFV